MNLKQLLFGHLQKTTNSIASSSVASNSVASSSVASSSLHVYFIVALIVSIFITFVIGLLCWSCIVICKKKSRRLQNNGFELENHEELVPPENVSNPEKFFTPEQNGRRSAILEKKISNPCQAYNLC